MRAAGFVLGLLVGLVLAGVAYIFAAFAGPFIEPGSEYVDAVDLPEDICATAASAAGLEVAPERGLNASDTCTLESGETRLNLRFHHVSGQLLAGDGEVRPGTESAAGEAHEQLVDACLLLISPRAVNHLPGEIDDRTCLMADRAEGWARGARLLTDRVVEVTLLQAPAGSDPGRTALAVLDALEDAL